ncbi:MAG TPA: DUF2628 domain-containing protein [Flavobacteriales bacterium]|nr:DUF2628 domain-containing protein [Flavobacteriales bacterium]
MEFVEHNEPLKGGPWGEFPDRYWRAYFGRSADHYIDQLHLVQQGQRTSFNFPAFLVAFPWMAYRKMYLVLLCAVIVLLIEGTLEEVVFALLGSTADTQTWISRAASLVIGLCMGTFANRIYLWDARRRIRTVVNRGDLQVEERLLERIARNGGTSWLAVLALLACLLSLVYVADLVAHM